MKHHCTPIGHIYIAYIHVGHTEIDTHSDPLLPPGPTLLRMYMGKQPCPHEAQWNTAMGHAHMPHTPLWDTLIQNAAYS